MTINFEIRDNPSEKRFEIALQKSMERIEAMKAQDWIYFNNTEEPSTFEGKGHTSTSILNILLGCRILIIDPFNPVPVYATIAKTES